MKKQSYTYDEYKKLVLALRNNESDCDKVKNALSTDNAKTLDRDVKGGLEKRTNRINSEFIQNVCHAAFGEIDSLFYRELILRASATANSQERLSKMCGKYSMYRPTISGESFRKLSARIYKTEYGVYIFNDETLDGKFKHEGYAISVDNRVSVISVRPLGVRYQVFDFQHDPSRNSVSGVVVNNYVDEIENNNKIFSVPFVMFHESHSSYGRNFSNDELLGLLPVNGIGKIQKIVF